jgi:hypothetical protein
MSASRIPFDIFVEVCRYGGDTLSIQFGLTCHGMKELVDQRVHMNRWLNYNRQTVYSFDGQRKPLIIGKYTRYDARGQCTTRYDHLHRDVDTLRVGGLHLESLPKGLRHLYMSNCRLWVSKLDQTRPVDKTTTFTLGQKLLILDTVQRWEIAIVMKSTATSIFVHYIYWQQRWDECLHVENYVSRVRLMDIVSTPFPATLRTMEIRNMMMCFPLPPGLIKMALHWITNWDEHQIQWPSLLTDLTICCGASDFNSFKTCAMIPTLQKLEICLEYIRDKTGLKQFQELFPQFHWSTMGSWITFQKIIPK